MNTTTTTTTTTTTNNNNNNNKNKSQNNQLWFYLYKNCIKYWNKYNCSINNNNKMRLKK